MLGLIAVYVATWTLTGPIGDFPLNDDWVYALAVRSILETGRFSLPSVASANVITQAYWGALFCLPFGFSFTALRVSTLILGIVGVLSLYLLLRELGGTRNVALAGALTLAVNPVFLQLSATFMTDVPFVGLVAASLWLHVRGVQRGSLPTICVAFLIALAALLIRQFALVLPLAYTLAYVTREGLRPRVLMVATMPVLAALLLHLGYEQWLITTGRAAVLPLPLSGLIPRHPVTFVLRLANTALISLPYFGLFTAPMLLYLAVWPRAPVAGHSWRTSPIAWLASLSIVMLLASLIAANKLLPAFGNILMLSGLGPLTLRDTFILNINQPEVPGVVRTLWVLASVLSVMATVMLGVVVVGTLSRLIPSLRNSKTRRQLWAHSLMIVLIATYFGGILLIGAITPVFERYMLPLIVPVIALLVLEHRSIDPAVVPARSWRAASCFGLLAVYVVFAVAGTHNYMSWNRARWQATASLMQAGSTPHSIDGGYEFNGWHLNSTTYQAKPGKSYWWVDDDEYIIASGPLDGYRQIARFGFDRWLGMGPSFVVVLRRAATEAIRTNGQ